MPGAWKGHPAHSVLFVFMQKTDKFWFSANGMRIIRHTYGHLVYKLIMSSLRTIGHIRVYEALGFVYTCGQNPRLSVDKSSILSVDCFGTRPT